jgi:hypothetical protein
MYHRSIIIGGPLLHSYSSLWCRALVYSKDGSAADVYVRHETLRMKNRLAGDVYMRHNTSRTTSRSAPGEYGKGTAIGIVYEGEV